MSVETSWRRSGAPSRISTSCSVSRRSAKMRAGAPSMNAGARPSRRRFGVCALVIGLGVITPAAHAERPVYRNLDDTGGVVYSDRALGLGSARVKIWKAANPSRSQYDAARAAPLAAYAPHRLRPRWDPNLPDSPAPSLERQYYYDGR